MAFELVEDAGPRPVPARRVHGPLLRPDDEVVDVILWDGETCCGHGLALLMLLLQRLLRVRKHVEAPVAHVAVRADGVEVVGVLRPDHLGGVHGGHHVGLAVENLLRSRLLKPGVPN